MNFLRKPAAAGLCSALLLILPIRAVAQHDSSQYGKQLDIAGTLGIGPAFDAVVQGSHLYVLAGGALHIASIADPKKPKVVGKLGGLGHVRQIVVRDNGIAYVTAREDGFFLIDVKRPEKPELITHYDTIELATGLALAGDVAFIACRHAGVELIDIANPRAPRHLSTLRVGEAQSLAADSKFMYIGVWATRELVIADVSNPRHPFQVSTSPLDGYGDGVAIRGDIAYVVTGHHSTGSGKVRPGPGQPGYGKGHGLELFDVKDRAHPRLLSRVKFPTFYGLYMDTWRVRLSGDLAFVNDTYNGIFVLNVADPAKPRVLAHRQLPVVPGIGDGDLPVDPQPGPAVGLALTKDYLYIAGSWSDVHIVPAPGLAAPMDPPPAHTLRAGPVSHSRKKQQVQNAGPAEVIYRPDGQVYAVDLWKKDRDNQPLLLVASGMAGLHVGRLSNAGKFEKLAAYTTKGFACSVAHSRDTIYVAEGMGGLGVYAASDSGDRMSEIARYEIPGYSVQQVAVTPAGNRALVHVGMNRLHILDVTNPAKPVRMSEDLHPGLFYQRAIPSGFAVDRYSLVTWTVSGPFLFDLDPKAPPKFTGFQYAYRIGTENGATPDGSNWLLTMASGKYFILKPGETRSPAEIGLVGIPGQDLSGKPVLSGNTLFISNALTGQITAMDVTERAKPKLLSTTMLPEHPGYAVEVDAGKSALVPGGYQGLLLWNYRGSSNEPSTPQR